MRTLLLISSSTLVRLGLEALAAARYEVKACLTAESPAEHFAHYGADEVDLVIVDEDLGEDECLRVCVAAGSRWPSVPILVLASTTEEEFARAAIEAGARGYVLKDAAPDQLVVTLEWLLNGQAVIDPRVTTNLLTWVLRNDELAVSEPLSPRELDVITLVSHGESNKAIAQKLGITEHTVKTYLKRACTKLGCHTRSAAAAAAAKKGLI